MDFCKTIIMCVVFSLIAIGDSTIFGQVSNENQISLEEIIQGIRYRRELIQNYKANVIVSGYEISSGEDEIRSPESKDILEEVKIIRKGKKIFIDKNYFEEVDGVRDNFLHTIHAWDGEYDKGYSFMPPKMHMGYKGVINSRKGSTYQTPYHLTITEAHVHEFQSSLAELTTKYDWKISGSEKIGSSLTWCIESIGIIEKLGGIKVWIDPTRDFVPLKMVLNYPIGPGFPDIMCEFRDVSVKEINGVWMIDEAKIVHDNELLGDELYVYHYAANELACGMEIDDDVFVIEFPEGTSVFDDITKISYKIGPGGNPVSIAMVDANGLGVRIDPLSPLSQEEWNIQDIIAANELPVVETEEGSSRESLPSFPTLAQGQPTSDSSGRGYITFIVIGSVLLIMMGVFMLIMRKRRLR